MQIVAKPNTLQQAAGQIEFGAGPNLIILSVTINASPLLFLILVQFPRKVFS